MDTQLTQGSTGRNTPRAQYRAGDLVLRRSQAVPVLCEVIAEEEAGVLRVRGLGWAPGFSVLVDAAELKSVTSLLR